MSKLTDKLEALLLWGQNRGTERVPMAMTMVADILADVRELEQNEKLARMEAQVSALEIRNAKREAYEHARHLNNVVFYSNAGEQASNLDKRLAAAIDALDTEGE